MLWVSTYICCSRVEPPASFGESFYLVQWKSYSILFSVALYSYIIFYHTYLLLYLLPTLPSTYYTYLLLYLAELGLTSCGVGPIHLLFYIIFYHIFLYHIS